MSGSKKNQENSGLSGLVASFFASLTQPLRDRARDSLSGVAPSVRRGLTAGLLKVEPGAAVRIKSRVAALFEGSFFASLPGRIAGCFVSVPSKSVAAFLITFSVVSLIASLFRMTFTGDAFSYFKLALPLIPASFAIPLLFTDRSLSQLAQGSFFLRTFLTEKIGVGNAKIGRKTDRPHSAAVMFILGTLFGLLTYLFGIEGVTGVLLLCAFAVFLSSFPESGFIIICAASPFFGLFPRPSLTAGICILSVAAGFFVRFATGRRSLFSANGGIPFLLLFVATFMSAFGAGRQSVLPAFAVCAMMLGFPLAVNLLRDGKRLDFFVSAMNFSVLSVSAVGIVQFVAGFAPSGWTDLSSFPGIGARVTSVFDNPNILAAWISCVFPFTLYSVYEGRGKARAAGVFTAVCAAVCSVLTFSRNGWLGILTGSLVFGLFVSFKYILLIPGIALGGALTGLIFKDSVGSRLLRFFSLSDSANAYRVKVWHGALEAAKHCLFTGAGAGDAAFKSVYTVYCLSGTETAVHSHSVYLQQLISAGLPGLVFLICFFAVMIRTAVGAFGRAGNGSRLLILGAAGFAGAAAMMITGLFDNVFYSYRTLFTFWTVCGAALSAFAAGCSEDDGLSYGPSESF